MNALLEELKGRQGELYHLQTRTLPVEFRSGKLESIKSKELEGVALRVIDNGRLGFGTTTNVKDGHGLVDAALATAAFGEKASVAFPAQDDFPSVDTYDQAIVELSERDLVELGEDLIARLERASSEVDINLSINKVVETVKITNTSGLDAKEERTSILLSVDIEKAREGDIFLLFEEAQASYLNELQVDRIANNLIQQLRWGERIVPTPSRSLPVVFSPAGAICLLLPLVVGFNGKSVFMGTSPLRGRIGETAFSTDLSIADDGTIPHGLRSSSFDDEGIPTAHTPLVSNGVIKRFVYDLRAAALAGVEPTGNGSRSGFRSLPKVGMTNVTISTGTHSQDEIIAELDEGILVDSVLGLGQGNIISGQFSNNVAVAFKIEHGKIVGRVKNTMIAGNAYALLKESLIALGNERRCVHGMLNTPTIAVDGVNVVGQVK